MYILLDAGMYTNIILFAYNHVYIYIRATAFIYLDKKRMWCKAGFEESLVSPAKGDQNEMGDSKNGIGFDAHHVYEHYLGSTCDS